MAGTFRNNNGTIENLSGGTNIDGALSDTSENPVQNKVINAALTKLNSDLDTIGTMYYTNTLKATSIQASTETEFIKNTSELEYGTYLASLRISLKTSQPTGGALLALKIGDKKFITEIPPISFIGNGAVTGVYKLDKRTDGISGFYYSINEVTIHAAELIIVRLK